MNTSRPWRRRLALAAGGLVLAALMAAGVVGVHVLGIANAFYAKTLCSGIFVSGRAQDSILAEDIRPRLRRLPDRFSRDVDTGRSTVRVTYLGIAPREALYRPGLGCTLLLGTTREDMLTQPPGPAPIPSTQNLPTAQPAQDVRTRLDRMLDAAFAVPEGRAGTRTRAVVVLRHGHVVAERYAEGIAPDMPLIGWSMGKSVVNALVGVLVREGRLSIDKPGLFPEWRAAGDPRAAITVTHLLQMTSGLDFGGDGGTLITPVQEMLFGTGDAASLPVSAALAAPPGSEWRYGSGSTLLLCRLIRDTLGGDGAALAFAREVLFAPLGMAHAVLEPDASGTPLGAAFVYASARDWARFGQFLLQDGVWEGRRILPENWVRFSAQATRLSGGAYGAHLWRRTPGFLRPEGAPAITLPEDRMLMLGVDGQMVAIVPSLDLVVVRLGMSTGRAVFDPDAFLAEVVGSFGG